MPEETKHMPSQDVADSERSGDRRLSTCSRSFSESKIEEIIAMLWTILFAILWANHAPQWILWTVGIKASTDHLCSVVSAIREIRRENVKALIRARKEGE